METIAAADALALALTHWLEEHDRGWKRDMREGDQEPGGLEECPCELCTESREVLETAGYRWEPIPARRKP